MFCSVSTGPERNGSQYNKLDLLEKESDSKSVAGNMQNEPRTPCSGRNLEYTQNKTRAKPSLVEVCQRSPRATKSTPNGQSSNNLSNKVVLNYNPKYEINIHIEKRINGGEVTNIPSRRISNTLCR